MFRTLARIGSIPLLAGLMGCLPTDAELEKSEPERATEVFEPTGGVEGDCMMEWDGSGPSREGREGPLAAAPIRLQSPTTGEILYEAKSDAKGKFRIKARPGKYCVTTDQQFPSKYYHPEVLHKERVVTMIEVGSGKFTQINVKFLGRWRK
jgi:hypothetical protein